MKKYIKIIPIFILISLSTPVYSQASPEPIKYPAISHNLPAGISYIPDDTVIWFPDESTGAEKIDLSRISGNSFECQIHDINISPSLKRNYPVRIYTLKDKLTLEEELLLTGILSFKEMVRMGIWVESDPKDADLSSRNLDLTINKTVSAQIKNTNKPYKLAFGETVTYDAGSDTIVVVGGTGASPYDFEDIYQADVSGNWSQVSKQGSSQYYFEAYLDIGDGANTTWFQDSWKEITFWNSSTPGHRNIEVMTNAVFTSGVLLDVNEHTTRYGNAFLGENTSNAGSLIYNNGGQVYLYSSHFSGAYFYVIHNAGRIWNCVCDSKCDTRTSDAYNLILSFSYLRPVATGNYENLFIQSGNEPLIQLAVATPITINNAVGYTTGSYGIRLTQCTGTEFHLVDTTLNIWGFSLGTNYNNSEVYRDYTVNIKVIDQDGNAIENASVTLDDKDGNEIFSVLTDSNGEISEQTVTYKLYTADEGAGVVNETTYSPHTLTVDHGSYHFVRIIENLDHSIDWVIGGQTMNFLFLSILPLGLTIAMFSSKNSLLGFPSLIFWAILSGYSFQQSSTTWDWQYFLFFGSMGMVIFSALAMYGLRTKKEEQAAGDAPIDEAKDEDKYFDEAESTSPRARRVQYRAAERKKRIIAPFSERK